LLCWGYCRITFVLVELLGSYLVSPQWQAAVKLPDAAAKDRKET